VNWLRNISACCPKTSREGKPGLADSGPAVRMLFEEPTALTVKSRTVGFVFRERLR